MKQLEKLDNDTFDYTCSKIIDKVNELVDAFNELNRTTRKIIFVEDEETKIPAAKKKKAK